MISSLRKLGDLQLSVPKQRCFGVLKISYIKKKLKRMNNKGS